MFEYFVLGLVQGIAEWLPVSSEGLIILVKNNFFGGGDFIDMVQLALFLHLGTFLAALVYFHKDVKEIFITIFKYKKSSDDNKTLLNFLFVTTFFTGVIGFILNRVAVTLGECFWDWKDVNVLIGIMLLVTGFLQLKNRNQELSVTKDHTQATFLDKVIVGLGQGFAAIPGISRSGITISLLLLRKFKEESALRLSFLLSLPAVLGANIVLNFSGNFEITKELLVGLITAAIFGYITIDLLLKVAKKVNFGKFVIGFGVLIILSVFI